GRWGDLIRRSDVSVALPAELQSADPAVRDEVIYRVRYRGYLERELRQIEKLRDVDRIALPAGLDYLAIPGLRRESAQKLQQLRPINLGQASRISGVNPADISILMVRMAAANRAGG
ncbi:MAG TPA: tRNA uridine-5-carboxymethylaminomethyl(34) synthesis enzyme MnmG, partial [Acidobacteriota bacterium]|nr:tRNA uridine-5-carboxymethylaminomethyl(34) synthesis enzyme MnmG [Acidobacteriota bacterium]